MSDSVRDMLAREATEAEEVADAEERGERDPTPGQRPRRPREASQVYSLRLPAEAIAQLRAIAERMEEAPTALLRRFVLERLSQEARAAEPVDALTAAVDDLLPLVRRRLLEAAHGSVGAEPVTATSAAPRRTQLNLGPSRRKPTAMTREMLA